MSLNLRKIIRSIDTRNVKNINRNVKSISSTNIILRSETNDYGREHAIQVSIIYNDKEYSRNVYLPRLEMVDEYIVAVRSAAELIISQHKLILSGNIDNIIRNKMVKVIYDTNVSIVPPMHSYNATRIVPFTADSIPLDPRYALLQEVNAREFTSNTLSISLSNVDYNTDLFIRLVYEQEGHNRLSIHRQITIDERNDEVTLEHIITDMITTLASRAFVICESRVLAYILMHSL